MNPTSRQPSHQPILPGQQMGSSLTLNDGSCDEWVIVLDDQLT